MEERTKLGFQALLALAIGFFHALPPLTQALLWIMVADILLGITVAVKHRSLSRAALFDGVTRKFVILVLMGVAAVLNPHTQWILGIDLVQAGSAFYLVYELTSVVRNAAILNVPVFSQLQDVLRIFSQANEAEKSKITQANARTRKHAEEGDEWKDL